MKDEPWYVFLEPSFPFEHFDLGRWFFFIFKTDVMLLFFSLLSPDGCFELFYEAVVLFYKELLVADLRSI